MILSCFDVVVDPRLIYINLHVQSEIPNSEYRKFHQSISAARLGLETHACQHWVRTIRAGGGGELGEEPEEAVVGGSIFLKDAVLVTQG